MKLQNDGWLLVVMFVCAAGWLSVVMAENAKEAAAPAGGVTVGEYTLGAPHTHENLTVWLIHGADKAKGRKFLTLQEALEKKVVVLHETGNVAELAIENVSSDQEVYVQSGDIVKGGKQDRTISMDFIVPPHSGKMPVASFCVEQGRWSKRGEEALTNFSSSEHSLSNKSVKLAAKYAPAADAVAAANPVADPAAANANEPAPQQAGVRQSAQRQSAERQGEQRTAAGQERYGQNAVWNAVAQEQRKLSGNVGQSVQAASSASSYQLSLENEKVREQTEAYVKKLAAAVEGKGDVVGYAFAINGKVNSVDVYASRDLFLKLWPKLLRASAVEALAEMKKDAKYDPASVETVTACITDAEKGKASTRPVTARVDVVTKESKDNLLFETRDKQAKDGEAGWVHRNYVAK